MTYKLIGKIYGNHPWNLIKFICDGKKIYPFWRISENGIRESSIIDCNSVKNIIFNNSKIIALDENYPIKKAIKYFLLRIGKEGQYNKFIFWYYDKILNVEDKTPIKVFFKNDPNPKIRAEERWSYLSFIVINN